MLHSYFILFTLLASDFTKAQLVSGVKNDSPTVENHYIRKSGKKSGKKSAKDRWKGIVVGGKTERSDLEIVSCNETSVEIQGPHSTFVSKGMMFVAIDDGSNKGCDACSPLFRQVKSVKTTTKGTKILTTSLATMEMIFESYFFAPNFMKIEAPEPLLGCECPNQNVAPNVTQSVGECDKLEESGGYSNTIQSFMIDLRRNNGIFELTYYMYEEPDALYIEYEGTRIFDTKGKVSYGTTTFVEYAGKSTVITVFIETFRSGTEWEFKVGCAKPK
jgi:hypothetical protein